MEYSEKAEMVRKLSEQQKRKNINIPLPTVPDEPELPEHLFALRRAFRELSTCRPRTQPVGSIPWTAIDSYATRYKYETDSDFRYFSIVIEVADHKVMNYYESLRSK